MKIPSELTTVTPLSKTVAFIVIIALPFIGFLFGIKYQKSISRLGDIGNEISKTNTLSPTIALKDMAIADQPSFMWKKYEAKNIGVYEQNTALYHVKFNFLKGYNVMQSNQRYSEGEILKLMVISDKDESCYYHKGNPCNITDQPLGLLFVRLQSLDLKTDLKTWIENENKGRSSAGTSSIESITAISTPYLKAGYFVTDSVGKGNGNYLTYFYDPNRKMVVEFSESFSSSKALNIQKDTDVFQVKNSFQFIK